MDLVFVDNLRQREKAQAGGATRTVRELVEYSAVLLVVDTFSQDLAVFPLQTDKQ